MEETKAQNLAVEAQEKNSMAQLLLTLMAKKCPAFMEPEGLSQCSRNLTNGPCLELVEFVEHRRMYIKHHKYAPTPWN
jgi:hypothetical protein